MAIEYRTEPEYCEWLDGKAHPKVSPRDAHGRAQARLAYLLIRCGAERHGTVGTEVDAAIGKRDGTKTKFIPDVSFILPEQRAGLTKRQADIPPFSPAIAIEIWSRGDTDEYLAKKFARYLNSGSQLVLDIRINEGTISAHSADGVETFHLTGTFRSDLFPWFTFELRELFEGLR